MVASNSADTLSDSVVLQQTVVVGLTEHDPSAGLESASLCFARTTFVGEGGLRADVDREDVPLLAVVGSGAGSVESQRPVLHRSGKAVEVAFAPVAIEVKYAGVGKCGALVCAQRVVASEGRAGDALCQCKQHGAEKKLGHH